jgi:hypothetical protein
MTPTELHDVHKMIALARAPQHVDLWRLLWVQRNLDRIRDLTVTGPLSLGRHRAVSRLRHYLRKHPLPSDLDA